ncbi:ParB/RepB/Spo0J family partition protein [Streptomyces albidoflavus]|uniref:ParB/RepB/Spo0J family partition protein n=1 Tax=Streptomyces albidoflavus TaxID=1886 RepID=UPI0033E12C09
MFKNIKMAQIVRREDQPREFFDEAALGELAESIKEYGLIQPIVVRKIESGKYEIVAGERRWRAHKLLNAITIQASITSEADDLRAFKKSASENLQRLDMTPLEEGRAFQRVLDEEEGATEASVAADFKKTVPFVRQRLALLKLIPEFAEHVNKGDVGTQAGVQLAALNPANQRAVLAKWARGDFAGDNQLVHFAYAMKEQQEQTISMLLEELTEEQRQERAKAQAKARNTLDGIEKIRGLLEQIVKADPAELAKALEGQVGARLEQMDRVADAVQKARFQLRQAKAHAEAAEVIVKPEVKARAKAVPAAAKTEVKLGRRVAPVKSQGKPRVAASPATVAKTAVKKRVAPAPAASAKPKAPVGGASA